MAVTKKRRYKMQYVSIKKFQEVYEELHKLLGFSDDDENAYVAVSSNKVSIIKLDPQNNLKTKVEKTVTTVCED